MASFFMGNPDASSVRLEGSSDVIEVTRVAASIPIARIMKLAEIQQVHGIAERGGSGGKTMLVL
jgi:hypothetical protein